ncbi:MAG: hypothetical protein Q9182_001197 [Xanthomendoza sp. 2 TL-2023]
MPSPKRHSPRAAIREWLSHTDETDPPECKSSAKYQEKKNECRTRKLRSPSHLNQSFSLPQAEASKPPREPDEFANQTRRKPGDHPAQLKNGRNKAEQLGLHAPFRAFATRSMDIQYDSEPEGQRRQQRRKRSSSSLYLEPAVHTKTSEKAAQNLTVVGSGKRGHVKQQDHVDIPSRATSITADSPEKPAKTYEKRSRHKTREDRYDLEREKKPVRPRQGDKKGQSTSRKRRKRVEKSGAALMQDFSAKNVETDRLTLKANVPVGLFGKGRASSPVRRKGLPDLTFSEVDFLNHRRGNQEVIPRSNVKSKRRKEDKVADAEAAFSRFFATSRDSTRESDKAMKHKEAEGEVPTVKKTKRHERSSLPPVELPEEPFAGFGSCGPGHVSPVMLQTNTVSDEYNRLSPIRKSLSERSTTYFTWSRSSPSKYTAARLRCGNQATPPEDHSSRLSKEPRLSRGCDRNNYHTPSVRPDEPRNSIEDHRTIQHSNLVPNAMTGHSDTCPIVETREEIIDQRPPEQRQERIHISQSQRSSQTNNNVSSRTDLASLLARQSRPELLGAVLDLLLGKVESHDSGPRESTKPPESTDSRGKDHVPVPEAISRVQQPNEASATEDRDLLRLGSNRANHSKSLAWISDSQGPQSFNTNKSKVEARQAVPDLQIPRSTTKKMKDRGIPNGLRHDPWLAHASCLREHRPDSNNAWTGYRNLYQGQLEIQPDTLNQSLDCEDIYQSNSHRSPSEYDPTAQKFKAAPGSVFIDSDHRNDMCEEDPSDESCPRHQHSATAGMDWSASASAETFQQEDGHSELLPEAGGVPYQQTDDFGNGESFEDGAGVVPEAEPPAFLGGRGFLNQGPEERFSFWNLDEGIITHDNLLNLSTRAEAADPAPVTGFWKPHRFY